MSPRKSSVFLGNVVAEIINRREEERFYIDKNSSKSIIYVAIINDLKTIMSQLSPKTELQIKHAIWAWKREKLPPSQGKQTEDVLNYFTLFKPPKSTSFLDL